MDPPGALGEARVGGGAMSAGSESIPGRALYILLYIRSSFRSRPRCKS